MNRVIKILKSIRPHEDFLNSDDYIESGMLDSFDVVTLITKLDQTFSISIDGADIVPEHLTNLEKIKGLLEKYHVTDLS